MRVAAMNTDDELSEAEIKKKNLTLFRLEIMVNMQNTSLMC